jgi:predicted nucleic acid-binding protein
VIYLDTSVLGALFFREPTTPAILARLETVGENDLAFQLGT